MERKHKIDNKRKARLMRKCAKHNLKENKKQ